jgi:hypothetical protein
MHQACGGARLPTSGCGAAAKRLCSACGAPVCGAPCWAAHGAVCAAVNANSKATAANINALSPVAWFAAYQADLETAVGLISPPKRTRRDVVQNVLRAYAEALLSPRPSKRFKRRSAAPAASWGESAQARLLRAHSLYMLAMAYVDEESRYALRTVVRAAVAQALRSEGVLITAKFNLRVKAAIAAAVAADDTDAALREAIAAAAEESARTDAADAQTLVASERVENLLARLDAWVDPREAPQGSPPTGPAPPGGVAGVAWSLKRFDADADTAAYATVCAHRLFSLQLSKVVVATPPASAQAVSALPVAQLTTSNLGARYLVADKVVSPQGALGEDWCLVLHLAGTPPRSATLSAQGLPSVVDEDGGQFSIAGVRVSVGEDVSAPGRAPARDPLSDAAFDRLFAEAKRRGELLGISPPKTRGDLSGGRPYTRLGAGVLGGPFYALSLLAVRTSALPADGRPRATRIAEALDVARAAGQGVVFRDAGLAAVFAISTLPDPPWVKAEVWKELPPGTRFEQ